MIFMGRQRLVNTLDDSYDSYEWTGQLYESIEVVSFGHSSGIVTRRVESIFSCVISEEHIPPQHFMGGLHGTALAESVYQNSHFTE